MPQFVTSGEQPGWFPDGKQLVVLRMLPLGEPFTPASFAVVTASGKLVRTFHTKAWSSVPATPDVSPDATAIVYGAWLDNRGGSLRMVGNDGSNDHWLDPNITGLFPLYGELPRWSPDGSTIAFTNFEVIGDFDSVETDIGVVDKAGANIGAVAAGISPTWSPDGSRIAFVHHGDGLQPGPLWMAGRNGSALTPSRPAARSAPATLIASSLQPMPGPSSPSPATTSSVREMAVASTSIAARTRCSPMLAT